MRFATLFVNRHSECWQSRRHLWPVNADSIAAKTPGTGGCTSPSRTGGAYVRAHAVWSELKPKHLSIA
jgi:hypothetical protein